MDKSPSSKRYPPELKERAVRMVGELQGADPGDQGVISRVARQLGMGTGAVREREGGALKPCQCSEAGRVGR